MIGWLASKRKTPPNTKCTGTQRTPSPVTSTMTNVNAAQKVFNKELSRMRVSVEWTFGKMVTQYAFVDYKTLEYRNKLSANTIAWHRCSQAPTPASTVASQACTLAHGILIPWGVFCVMDPEPTIGFLCLTHGRCYAEQERGTSTGDV